MAIGVGDRVPDFTLLDQTGARFVMREHLGHGPLVIYFYPKDETRGCTAEACAFRDSHEDFVSAGAKVVGISSDTVASHQSFANNHKLPFTLLADVDGAVRKAFDVPRAFIGLVDGRVTYVVDSTGIVRHTFNSAINMSKHVDEAIAVVRTLKA